MTSTSINALAFAEVLEALPARLRKRLDGAVERAADWPHEATEGGELIRVDDETTVTLRPTGGVVLAADDVVCSCLLAPACLHRAAIAARLPVHDPNAGTGTGSGTGADTGTGTADDSGGVGGVGGVGVAPDPTLPVELPPEATPLTARERAAASALWESAASVLVAGLVGNNLFTEAELARATHQARAVGLHRAAALGARVATGLRSARDRRDDHRVEQFVADLRELLLTTYQLTNMSDTAALAELRGISRRSYTDQGSMRLHGLFAEAIAARTGHAGVVGYAVDGSGVLWSTASIGPGGPELIRPSYDNALKLGGTTLTQRELSRSGLLVSGASSSPDGRLSSGTATKAVRTDGVPWTEQPIAGLFDEPLADQLARALRADRDDEAFRAGDDLVFLRARILGGVGGLGGGSGRLGGDGGGGGGESGLILALEDPEGANEDGSAERIIRCLPIGASATYRHNFAMLAEAPQRIQLIARPDKLRPGTVHGLAISLLDHDTALDLPESWSGRINLGLDRIPVKKADEDEDKPEPEANPVNAAVDAPAIRETVGADQTSLPLLRHHVEQAAAAGRAITRTALLDRDCARLDRDALHIGAALLRDLAATAEPVRDAFHRTVNTKERPKDAYPLAWLAAAVYTHAAAADLTVSRWLNALG